MGRLREEVGVGVDPEREGRRLEFQKRLREAAAAVVGAAALCAIALWLLCWLAHG